MRRSSVLLTILFLTIGFATISTTLIIRGGANIGINEDDFNVYFSDVKVNGIRDLSVVVNERELEFSTTMKIKNEKYVVEYDVTNGSKNYDAKLEMTCTGSNDYLSVNNEFDTSSNLLASETRSGKLTITLEEQYTGRELNAKISCTINANGVERTEIDTGIPSEPLERPKWIYIDSDDSGDISKGDEITLASNSNEKFNVISRTLNTVTMLAKYNLNTAYHQSTTVNGVSFSNVTGWEYTPGPKEIDVATWGTDYSALYLNEYVSYLMTETNDNTITGNLITLSNLRELECVVPYDHAYVSDIASRTCVNSPYKDWLINGQNWWTRSAYAGFGQLIWYVYDSGAVDYGTYDFAYGIRPIITISVDALGSLVNTEMDPVSFCESQGYVTGEYNVQNYLFGREESGDISKAVYLCTNTTVDDQVYGFDADGNLVYELYYES